MERSRAVLLTIACVLFSRISGAEVEMRVRPGDNVILYSDCVWKTGEPVWFRNSSNENQRPLIISSDNLIQAAFSRYAFLWSPSDQTHDLLVKNITESDLGLYYCAVHEIKLIKGGAGADVRTDVYHHGNRTTRLSLLDCSVCWKLLVSVCSVCVLLSSTCVCCIYRHTTKVTGERKVYEAGNVKEEDQRRSIHGEVGGDVIYAPLDVTRRGQNRLKKNRVQRSDICTYSEVIFDPM
ncbi:uncharacterized protein LOC108413469 [Pygocentrus nattereri]|uniref:uncharacterized protein LOC108413469 n=1 Tax=Pygocentrus nattereri TaxID=42514 RepID=UPI001891EA2B|nr:uncharacterized protein LOC108413469 [Pygocentrus nattereri]